MKSRPPTLPIALTIAGSDSGGGAGLQADLKTFSAFGVHGVSVITALTAQNPARVLRIEPVTPRMVTAQLEAVFTELPPAALKTGMLFSARLIRAVADFLETVRPLPPLVLDPVMISTSGSQLLQARAVQTLEERLIPLAAVVTPNLAEAKRWTGLAPKTISEMIHAAEALHRRLGRPVLLKGGHLGGSPLAVDVFFDGSKARFFRARRIPGLKTHGTGCVYSAAITASLARGRGLIQAIDMGKKFVTKAIATAALAHHHPVLNTLKQ